MPEDMKKQWQHCLSRYKELKKVWKKEPPSMDIYVKEAGLYKQLIAFFDIPRDAKVLDIGAGEGKIKQFLPAAVQYQGIDPLADEFPSPDVIKGVGEDLGMFADVSFNVVLIHSSLDHVYLPERVFEEAFRVLRDGGMLCVSNLVDAHQNDHVFSFSSDSIISLIIAQGFKIIRKQMGERKSKVLDILAAKGALPARKRRGYIVLGGILVGDTLRLNTYIEECAAQVGSLHGVCDNYNKDALELFKSYSDVPLDSYSVIQDYHRSAYAWRDFEIFADMNVVLDPAKEYDEVFRPNLGTLSCPLAPFEFIPRNLKVEGLPEEYIVVQPASRSSWKNMNALIQVKYPLPVVNISTTQDLLVVPNAIRKQDKPLPEVTCIMSKAKLVVGIDSSMSQLAAQVGVPAIKCHFGGWEFMHRNVRDCGGADLFKPSADKVAGTIKQALELIDNGERDISKLTEKR